MSSNHHSATTVLKRTALHWVLLSLENTKHVKSTECMIQKHLSIYFLKILFERKYWSEAVISCSCPFPSVVNLSVFLLSSCLPWPFFLRHAAGSQWRFAGMLSVQRCEKWFQVLMLDGNRSKYTNLISSTNLGEKLSETARLCGGWRSFPCHWK